MGLLVEISGVCQNCAEQVKVLMMDGEPVSNCTSCDETPFGSKSVKGVIYVVANKNQIGVKVGLTTKHIDQRVKALSSTGVPGRFEKIAIFPSDRPEADEKKVHEKLARHRLDKEHFDLDPVEAVLKAHRALNYREPIFFDEKLRGRFKLLKEQGRIEMKLRLSS